MPQHYHYNYRIAFWILKYGWISALMLVGLIILTQIAMIWTAIRIRNRLAHLIAAAVSIAFMVQNLFYIMGAVYC